MAQLDVTASYSRRWSRTSMQTNFVIRWYTEEQPPRWISRRVKITVPPCPESPSSAPEDVGYAMVLKPVERVMRKIFRAIGPHSKPFALGTLRIWNKRSADIVVTAIDAVLRDQRDVMSHYSSMTARFTENIIASPSPVFLLSTNRLGHTQPPVEEDDIGDARRDIEAELTFSVSAIYRHQTSKHGVYVGAPGMLMMEWTITDIVHTLRDSNDDSIMPPKTNLYAWFPFQKPTAGSRTGFLDTDIGAATLILISDLREGLLDAKGGTDRSRASAILVREAVQLAVDGNDPKDDDGCEVLYGRAGLLYALLFLKEETRVRRLETHDRERALDAFSDIVEQLCHEQNIAALVDEIIARGRRGAKFYASEARSRDQQTIHAPALMWSWHGKRYLGGAHGIAGILQMLVSVPSYMLQKHWDSILHTLQWLVDIQDPDTGSWSHKASRDMLTEASTSHSSSRSNRDSDTMVQWCHGAPGVLILFSKLLRQEDSYGLDLPESLCDSMRDALLRGADLVYERGLLRKGVGLCHGIAGSVYTLLAVSDVLDEQPSASLSTHPDSRPKRARSRSHRTTHGGFDATQRYWFSRAFHLAHLATSYRKITQRGEMRSPDRPVLRRLNEREVASSGSSGELSSNRR
ncbi:hypothetical protein BC629DRAFT_1440115 [Irpex lacteus]|nr:hypothetical protein BC629DRAFT_1440115 [Irpex lacteus]